MFESFQVEYPVCTNIKYIKKISTVRIQLIIMMMIMIMANFIIIIYYVLLFYIVLKHLKKFSTI